MEHVDPAEVEVLTVDVQYPKAVYSGFPGLALCRNANSSGTSTVSKSVPGVLGLNSGPGKVDKGHKEGKIRDAWSNIVCDQPGADFDQTSSILAPSGDSPGFLRSLKVS